jgi:hypothetical protein
MEFSSYYIKLVELGMTLVLGLVEDERCFSPLTFLKDKPRNMFDGHLYVGVGIHEQIIYNLENVPDSFSNRKKLIWFAWRVVVLEVI